MNQTLADATSAAEIVNKLSAKPLIADLRKDYYAVDVSKFFPKNLGPVELRMYVRGSTMKGNRGATGVINGVRVIALKPVTRNVKGPTVDMAMHIRSQFDTLVHEIQHAYRNARGTKDDEDAVTYHKRAEEIDGNTVGTIGYLLQVEDVFTRWKIYDARSFANAVIRYLRINKTHAAAKSVATKSAEIEKQFDAFVAAHKKQHGEQPMWSEMEDDVVETLLERYGGAAKERAIWYHGTRPANLASIMSQGLVPDLKKRAWEIDKDASYSNISRVSYGGIYLTRNLMTASSSSTNHFTGASHKDGSLIVIMSIQPRTLLADEDSVTNRVHRIRPPGMIDNPPPVLLQTYMMWLVDPSSEYVHELQTKYVMDTLRALSMEFPALKERTLLLKRVREVVEQGFYAVLKRQAAYLDAEIGSRFKWMWLDAWINAAVPWTDDNEAYKAAKVEMEKKVPTPPSKAEGEAAFKQYVDSLTRAMKDLPRAAESGSFTHGRSMQPIRFKGANKIVAIVLVRYPNAEELATMLTLSPKASKHSSIVELKYGTLPAQFVRDFEKHYSQCFVKSNQKIALAESVMDSTNLVVTRIDEVLAKLDGADSYTTLRSFS